MHSRFGLGIPLWKGIVPWDWRLTRYPSHPAMMYGNNSRLEPSSSFNRCNQVARLSFVWKWDPWTPGKRVGMAGLNSPHCSAHFIACHCVSHIVLTPWHWRSFCPVLAVRQFAASTCNLHWVSVKVPWYLTQRMLRLLTPEDTVMIALVLSSGNFCLPWLLTSQWFFKIQSFEVNLSKSRAVPKAHELGHAVPRLMWWYRSMTTAAMPGPRCTCCASMGHLNSFKICRAGPRGSRMGAFGQAFSSASVGRQSSIAISREPFCKLGGVEHRPTPWIIVDPSDGIIVLKLCIF